MKYTFWDRLKYCVTLILYKRAYPSIDLLHNGVIQNCRITGVTINKDDPYATSFIKNCILIGK